MIGNVKKKGDPTCNIKHMVEKAHSQGFSICFIMNNPLNSPLITLNFQNKLYFQSELQNRQHALIQHATMIISSTQNFLYPTSISCVYFNYRT